MKEHLRFLWSFFKDPVAISSVIPTSRFGIREVADKIQGDVRRVIVEYGPGTGGVAKALLKEGKLTPDSKLILIERSRELATHLAETQHDPRVHLFNDSAENVRTILAQCGEESADYILSSIPLTVMPKEVRGRILSESRAALKPGASMITYLFRGQVTQWLRKEIGPTVAERVWFNIPPLVVSEARKSINGTPILGV